MIGGIVVSEDFGYKFENVEFDMLGFVKKVTVSKDDIIMLDGVGESSVIEE